MSKNDLEDEDSKLEENTIPLQICPKCGKQGWFSKKTVKKNNKIYTYNQHKAKDGSVCHITDEMMVKRVVMDKFWEYENIQGKEETPQEILNEWRRGLRKFTL